MRFINKYKYLHNLKLIPNLLSNRFTRFKRPKWKKFQKQSQRQKISFFDIFLQKLIYKQWNRLKLTYRKGLESNKLLNIFLDTKFPLKYYKKNITFLLKNLILNFLIKKNFRIDLLLWKLQIFKSSYESRQCIKSNFVLINNKPTVESYIVKKGDIIKLNKSFLLAINSQFKNNSKINFIFSYIEIDYYTNCIIVIKDLKNFSKEDCFLILQNQNQNLKNFLYYLKLK